jgi:nitronate monooxygenase
VIAQGVEAGGDVRGTTSIRELLPKAVDALGPLPVLDSGGMGDGAGVAGVLGLGAQGVSLSTGFVTSDEAWVHPEYKRRVATQSFRATMWKRCQCFRSPTAVVPSLSNSSSCSTSKPRRSS